MVSGFPVLEGTWYKGTQIPEESGIANIVHSGSWARVNKEVFLFHRDSLNTYVYNIDKDHWTVAERIPTPRANMGCVVIGKKIYCIGGLVPNGSATASAVEIFDTVTGAWTSGQEMPVANSYMAILSWKGNIYCFGGREKESPYATLKYDVDSDNWTMLENAPTTKVASYAHVLLDDQVYWVNDLARKNFEIFNLETERWSYGPDVPTQRKGQSFMATHNDKVYCIAGSTTAVEYYDVRTQSWTKVDSKPTGDKLGVLMAKDGKFYIVGHPNSFEIYDANTGTWQVAEDTPNEVYFLTPVFLEGNKIYSVGNYDNMKVNIFHLKEEEETNPDDSNKKGCFRVEVRVTSCGSNTELLQDLNDVIQRHGKDLDCNCRCCWK